MRVRVLIALLVGALLPAGVPAQSARGDGDAGSGLERCAARLDLTKSPFDSAQILGVRLASAEEVEERLDRHAMALECLRRDLRHYLGRIADRPTSPPVDLSGIERQLRQLEETIRNRPGDPIAPPQMAAQLVQVQAQISQLLQIREGGDQAFRERLLVAVNEQVGALRDIATTLSGPGPTNGAVTHQTWNSRSTLLLVPPSANSTQVAPAASVAVKQIDPAEPVSRYYAALGQLRFALMAVPDPRVPRHGRAYDHDLAALMSGMLKAGYVLDRYNFPWQEALSRRRESGVSFTPELTDDGHFGLMIFRQDTWRHGESTAESRPNVLALYVVPETATAGVAQNTLRCAIRRIATQLNPKTSDITEPKKQEKGAPKADERLTCDFASDPGDTSPGSQQAVVSEGLLAAHPQCTDADDSSVVLLGPHFSGSVDSLRQAASRSLAPGAAGITRLCTVSATATAESNARISTLGKADAAPAQHPGLSYHALTVRDRDKIKALQDWLLPRLGIEYSEVAFLTEASIFGMEVCPARQDQDLPICEKARQISFPANIADVRYRLHQQRQDAAPAIPKEFDASRSRLALEEGSENGSEFPEGLQAKLTDVAVQMQIKAALRQLADGGARLVVVVATDVRDRLFLFDQVRDVLPNVMLVDLETDRLLGHPDFIHASRGSVTLASSNLETDWRVDGGRPANWVTDGQALLACAAFELAALSADAPYFPFSCRQWNASRQVRPQVVTRDGLQPWELRGHRSFAAMFVGLVLAAALAGVLWVLLRKWGAVGRIQQCSRGRGAWPVGDGFFIAAASVVALPMLYLCIRSEPAAFIRGWDRASGMAIHLAAVTALGVIFWARTFLLTLRSGVADDDQALVRGGWPAWRITDGGLGLLPAIAMAAYIIALVLLTWCGLRPTLQGPAASWLALAGLCFATVAALLFLFLEVGLSLRLKKLTGFLRAMDGPKKYDDAGQPTGHRLALRWPWEPDAPGRVPDFPATPAFASRGQLPDADAANPLGEAGWLKGGLSGTIDASHTRLALFALLASEVGLIRIAAIATVICALGAVAIAYLFPVTSADIFVATALLVLLACGAFSAYTAINMERDSVLSGVLCNTSPRLQFSTQLLLAIVVPFAIAIVALWVAQIPGVTNWGGGILNWMLDWMGYPG